MNRVLLINARTRTLGPFRPTGVEYVAEWLLNGGYMVDVLDLCTEDEPEAAVDRQFGAGPYDVVGISIFNTELRTPESTQSQLPGVRELVSQVRRLAHAPILLGGYGFSIQPKTTLEYVGADFGLAGCGIPTVTTLLRRIETGQIERGTVVVAEEPQPYLDLAFRRDVVAPEEYSKDEFSACVSRMYGCPGTCMFCPCSKRKAILRRPEHVVAEIGHLLDQGAKSISFPHDMANFPIDHARRLFDAMAGLPSDFAWVGTIWPAEEHFSDDLADAMKRSGLVSAYVDAASGSDRMLRRYRKGITVGGIARVAEALKDRDIPVTLCFGLGGPGESRETIDETFALIDRLQPACAGLFTQFRIYKDTELAHIAEREGVIDPADDLLLPVLYPFPLRDYALEQADQRDNCITAW